MGRMLFGAVVGAVVGAIAAVNVVIFSGMEEGYETSLPEVFRQNSLVGVAAVGLLVAGPIVGAFVARRRRPVVIVEATSDHIPAIATFFREAWAMTGPDAPGWAGASDEVIESLTDPELIRSRIGGPERRMHLAMVGARVVGFAATRSAGAESELAGIVVLQDMVGRGIGTPLLQAALTGLRADGATSVFVRTEADNERALAFYRARGFGDERSVKEEVEGTAVELIELRRDL